MSFAAALRWVRTSSIWTSRALAWTVVGIALTCAFVVLGLRYWLLPNIQDYRDDIASAVSRAAKVRITIGKIAGDWDGMRPRLVVEDLTIFDKAGRRALKLERVESTLAWRSLAAFNLHFHSLDIHRPVLVVRRDPTGVLSVAGIELENKHTGFTAWLLEQPDVEVHDAIVSWTDELRQAPPLELAGVGVQMVNRGNRHRFGLRARPPSELAGPLDVRGDVRGTGAEVVANWNGKVYLQVESPDVAAWNAWVNIPVEISRGAGAVRTWLTFTNHRLAEIIADVKLAGVRTRLREGLPELDLETVSGRFAWKHIPSGFEFSTHQVALSAGGVVLPSAEFLVRVSEDKQHVQQGELNANALELGPLASLGDRLPIDEGLRADLLGLSPRGSVHDLVVKWKGKWPTPEQYSARGRFDNFAFNRWGKLPGVSGLSGTIDGSEKSGTLELKGQTAKLDLPDVFSAPLALDTLTANVGWTRSAERVELRFSNVSFANADGAGTAFGSYRSPPQGRGEIDLTGSLSRADARSVPRYMPVNQLRKVRPWLERAIIAGASNDVRFRIKGRLEDFPFPQDKRGIFHITAKIFGGTLDYAERWPRIENIEGDLQFRGTRMDFNARQGAVLGVKLGPVQGEIADMTVQPQVLDIKGEAEGSTPDFLAFVAKSPVGGMIDHFTDSMQAQGNGKLGLRLTLPLGQESGTKVAGAYVFNQNHLVFERDLPPLEQAGGRIEFTENSVRVPGVSGIFLGGPVAVAAASQRDGPMRVTMQGRVNADNVRKAGGPTWMQQMRGATDWRGVMTLRKKVPEIVIESNLQGISSTLPAPFAKTATDTVPLRIERRLTGAQQDRISFAYGDIVKAELARRNDGKQTIIERGAVRLGGGEAGEPTRNGVWVAGALKTFDFDEWLAFSRGEEGDTTYTLAGADVKFAEVGFFGRRFNDISVNAWTEKAITQFTLAGREIEGGVMWRGEGKGRLTARLRRLTLPTPEGKPSTAITKPPSGKPLELPALDVIVEQFQYGIKQLGKLELNAVHQERDWRIEKLRISSPDNVLTADGIWQGWLTQPRTQLNLRIDVTDIGRALARWALPSGIRRGTAKIEGQLSWAGSPHDFDYPTLSGNLVFDAANGQFVKLEPGMAKLLGILSLQSLPRRITLDFRDVFSEGFAFDGILGSVNIDRGVAHTDNFRIAGPSARVIMTGDVDLARETQKLRVRVTPHLSESVSIAGALIGGPIAGVAAFLAQKILKDPIEQLVSFEYNVTGNWSDPHVAKVERTAARQSTGDSGP